MCATHIKTTSYRPSLLLIDPAWFFSNVFSWSCTWFYCQFSFESIEEWGNSAFVSWPGIAWSWKSCEKTWWGENSTAHRMAEKRRTVLFFLIEHRLTFWHYRMFQVYLMCPIPRINHFSKGYWFLLLESGLRKEDLALMCFTLPLSVLATMVLEYSDHVNNSSLFRIAMLSWIALPAWLHYVLIAKGNW